jgi:hypothetical protein
MDEKELELRERELELRERELDTKADEKKKKKEKKSHKKRNIILLIVLIAIVAVIGAIAYNNSLYSTDTYNVESGKYLNKHKYSNADDYYYEVTYADAELDFTQSQVDGLVKSGSLQEYSNQFNKQMAYEVVNDIKVTGKTYKIGKGIYGEKKYYNVLLAY